MTKTKQEHPKIVVGMENIIEKEAIKKEKEQDKTTYVTTMSWNEVED
ncbi:MAG: hypothetical protein ACOX4L_06105 [Bacillota bacterium]|jgi:hypothetical protein